MRGLIGNGTAVFQTNPGEPSCIGHLQDKFNATYPVHMRRLEFFRISQSSGQEWDTFCTQMDQLAVEADLAQFTPETIKVHVTIRGTTDLELKERFLRLPDPTLAQLKEAASNFFAAKRSIAAQQGKPAQAARVQTAPARQLTFNGKPREDMCYRCGKTPRHQPGDKCWAEDKQCDNCKIKGHIFRTAAGTKV